jgi:L-ascorbate metabolism protein UlaG (beta-lactamase superfamily)
MGQTSDHFDGRKFHNINPRQHGFPDLLRWMISRQRGKWPKWRDSQPGPKPPQRVPQPDESPDALRITFVNHTTFLLQMFGLNILTDPVWSRRASPLQWMGPARVRAPGIRFQDLPKIDAVLLSHDHYDHMDVETLGELRREHDPQFYTGLGNRRRFEKIGNRRAHEMDWWDEAELNGGVKLVCVPAQHFSGRSPFDRDTTLWCGFVLVPPPDFAASGAVYFAADTGFGPHFHLIAERFPNIRLSILPIGAFRPEWFMGEVHCSPREAVKAHKALGTRISVASHFGTFPLADDGEVEPVHRLAEALQEEGLTSDDFRVPGFGEGWSVP